MGSLNAESEVGLLCDLACTLGRQVVVAFCGCDLVIRTVYG